VSLLSEVLVVGGVALDLVGAGVLSHAHNAESIMQIREEVGGEATAVGEKDVLATHAQLLAEKRIGFFTLTLGLTLYLIGLVLKSSEGIVPMALLGAGVVIAGFGVSVIWTRLAGRKLLKQARDAKANRDGEELPEQ
jgi:hypothetical protein